MLRKWAKADPWWATVAAEVEEVDLLRGKVGDDLTEKTRQDELQEKIDDG